MREACERDHFVIGGHPRRKGEAKGWLAQTCQNAFGISGEQTHAVPSVGCLW